MTWKRTYIHTLVNHSFDWGQVLIGSRRHLHYKGCFCRLQLQGEVAAGETSVAYRGMVRTAVGIVREEVGHRPASDLRIMVYLGYF